MASVPVPLDYPVKDGNGNTIIDESNASGAGVRGNRAINETALNVGRSAVYQVKDCTDKSVHIWGDFGTDGAGVGKIKVQGSMDPIALTNPSSASWVTLKDTNNDEVLISDVYCGTIVQVTEYISFLVEGDGNQAINVGMIATRNSS